MDLLVILYVIWGATTWYYRFRYRGYASHSGASVISAAKLDTGALLSSQLSWSMASPASTQVPYSRLKSTRLSTRL